VRRDDEDDRSGGAGGPSWVDRIVIPDDIGELDADVRALHRERRARRRRARLRRLTGSGSGGPLLLVALLLIAGIAGLLVMFQPRRITGSVTPPGAAQATDSRLPDTPVELVGGTTRQIRDFRPAVFALAPNGCNCDAALAAVGAAVHKHNLRFFLVDRSVPRLPRGLTDGTATRLIDRTGVVAEKYNAEKDGTRVAGGPVLVLVGAGGQVTEVLPQPDPSAVERDLSALAPKAASAS
jgi:hypothetical protein